MFVWIVAVTIFIGNIAVIVTRVYLNERGLQPFFIVSLVLSDILMGVYLVIIAYKNVEYMGEYFEHDEEWRSSISCTVAGVMSLLSSQVSLFIIAAITTERYCSIIYAVKNFATFSRKLKGLIVFSAWSIGCTISIIPAVYPRYFNSKEFLKFYGQNTVCLPLQLSDPDREVLGWEYCLVLFGGVNTILCLYITSCYIAIYVSLRRNKDQISSVRKRENSDLAKRMLGIVLTNLCCWFPIIVFTFISLHGFHRSVNTLQAWTAVCLFPINSALNPAIYTYFVSNIYHKLRNALGLTNNNILN